MDPAPFYEILPKLYIYVIAASLAITRVMPIVIIVPVFTRLGLSGILTGAVALALAFPVIPMHVAWLGPQLPPMIEILPLLIKEPIIGITVALVMSIPFWAAEGAGDVLDFQRASAFAGLADPASSTEQSVTGSLLSVAIVGLFFVSGGMDILLRVVYGSYGIWPATQLTPVFDRNAGFLIIGMLDDLTRLGVMLVVPLIMALFLSDMLLALLARASPNLHVFDLSLSMKSLVLVVVLALYAPFLARYMADALRRVPEAPVMLERLVGKPHDR